MKPQRPDSAKSAKTRITIDSQISSTNITHSRFSQTYSNGVKLNSNKNSQFEKYVAQKDKDPKFKKFMQTNLPEIPQQIKQSTQLSRLTSKPFQKKPSKIDKQKVQKKIQQPQKKVEQDYKTVKKQNLQSSKTFIDKSKQKLKIPSKQDIQENQKIEQKNQNIDQNNKKDNNSKPKINLNGFVLNVPGKPPQVIKQQKVQQKIQETKQQKQKRERQKLMTEISQFIQQVQDKNIDYLPKRYGQFIDRKRTNKDQDIDKINIQDFLEPNQRDYQNLIKKINQNQKQLQSSQKSASNEKSLSNSSLSINLQQIIDGSDAKKQQQVQQSPDDVSVIMSSMSASDYRDRNMFLTQILKGKRLTNQQLQQIKQNDDTIMKLIKLEGHNKEQQEDDEVQIVQINMNKKKTNRIMERNKLEAVGQLFRQCDYLTPEEQQRIQDILSGEKIQSPFERSQMENLMIRGIDEGIKLHRKLCRDIQGLPSTSQDQVLIDEATLPKDPTARKKAQLKILRQKINSINQRLSNVNNDVVVNKNKIQNLVNKYKQATRPSKMSQSIIEQKNKQIQQQCQQLKEAQNILKKAQSQKQQINKLLEQMTLKFSDMQGQVIRLQKMDSEQLRKMQQDQLKLKRKKVQQVQKQAKQFEAEVDNFIAMGQYIKQKMENIDQIIKLPTEQPKCEGYHQGETIEDLDRLVTLKWQAAQEAVKNIPEHPE